MFSFVPRAEHETQCTMLIHVPRNSATTWTVRSNDSMVCSRIQIGESAIVERRSWCATDYTIFVYDPSPVRAQVAATVPA